MSGFSNTAKLAQSKALAEGQGVAAQRLANRQARPERNPRLRPLESPRRGYTLQRQCASCSGQGAGLSGKCPECEKEDLLGTEGLQTKLTVNAPGDRYEQEADRVADQVMRDESMDADALPISPLIQRQEMPEEEEEQLQTARRSAADPLQRQEAGEEEEEELQAKSASGPAAAASHPGFAAALGAEAAGGTPLGPAARSFFEPRFGRDFSQVRVHASGRADALNRSINARAFTHDKHIFFGAGQYDPSSLEGRRLLAHELTHTVQQEASPQDRLQRKAVASAQSALRLSRTGDRQTPNDFDAELTEAGSFRLQGQSGAEDEGPPSPGFARRLRVEKPGGAPLAPQARAFFEPRFGRSLGDIRIHRGGRAEALSRQINARAFTHRRHIFFGAGQYDPRSSDGRRLIAHELAHSVQQSLHQQAPSLQRRNIFEEIAGLFRSDDIPDDELRQYLQFLNDSGRKEDFTDSDNKARAVVNRLRNDQDLFGFELTVRLRKLLIQEMQSGFTGNDDEEAILHLMTSTDVRTVQSLFEGENALDAEDLLSDFHGPQERRLLNLYAAIGVEVENLQRRDNFEGCNDPEKEAVQEGMDASRGDLRRAITFMEEHAESPAIAMAFWLAFRISEPDEDQKRDMLEKLRSIREGIPRAHYICDHGQADTSCNDGALGHASLGPGGDGISICTAPPGQHQENDFYSVERPEKASLITHEAAHFFLAVDDTGGYFGSECQETLIDSSCLRGTRQDCGTSGRPPAERLDTADAYACFVRFLLMAVEEAGREGTEEGEDPTLEERFRESRGESIVIKAYIPESIFSEQMYGEAIYVNSPQGTEKFALDGVPGASGFSYLWTLQAGGQTFELQEADYLDKPGAIVPEAVKARLRELVASRTSGASGEGEQAAAPRVSGEVVCRVRLFTGAPEADQVEKRLEVDLETGQPDLGL